MKKVSVIKKSEFVVVERDSNSPSYLRGRGRLTITCEAVIGTKSDVSANAYSVMIEKTWDGPKLVNFKLNTGEENAPTQTNFEAFRILGLEVSTDKILKEAAAFFTELEEKEAAEKEAADRIKRAEVYDTHEFVTGKLRETLEAAGRSCTVSQTREQFVERQHNYARDLSMTVDGKVIVDYDHNGWMRCRNDKWGDDRREGTYRGSKLDKKVELVERILLAIHHDEESAKAKAETANKEKAELEKLLGIKVVEKEETKYSQYRRGGKTRSWQERWYEVGPVKIRRGIEYERTKPVEYWLIIGLGRVTDDQLKGVIKVMNS